MVDGAGHQEIQGCCCDVGLLPMYEKNGYNWNSLDIDWKEFNKDVDLVMSDVSKKNKIHNPYSKSTTRTITCFSISHISKI